jgi:hypothetical protein
VSPIAVAAAVALVVVAAWVTLYVAASRRAEEGDPARARGANLAMLVATAAASVATCAAPVGSLVSAFGRVAVAPPEEKSDVLAASIDSVRPIMWLALASIPILVAGGRGFAANRRRIREGARVAIGGAP